MSSNWRRQGDRIDFFLTGGRWAVQHRGAGIRCPGVATLRSRADTVAPAQRNPTVKHQGGQLMSEKNLIEESKANESERTADNPDRDAQAGSAPQETLKGKIDQTLQT